MNEIASPDGLPFRRRLYVILNLADPGNYLPRLVRDGLVALILVNVVAAVLETVPSLAAKERALLHAIEVVSLIIFSIEYAARLWVSVEDPRFRGMPAWQARLRYAVTPVAIIDLIAVAPFFLSAFTAVNLRTLILVRLLRLFKLARYSTGFQSLFEATRRERHALLACLIILFSVVLVFAALMYELERDAQPETFGSIPEAAWWAIETVTTVGYGDAIPTTALGRMLGGLTMIAGLVMLALPVAIISSSFAEVVRQRGFIVSFGLVSRIPIFARLDSGDLNALVPLLRAMTIDPGTVIVEEAQSTQALYVVIDGEVEVDEAGTRHLLGEGDAFGGVPFVKTPNAGYPAFAVTAVKLLMLESGDLAHLMERPGFGARLRAASVAAKV